MHNLKGKHIVLGITGSIAAYKACTLIRLFVKAGAEVQVVITPAGKEFITPVTLSALTSKPVVSEFFSGKDGSWHSHVDLGLWADAMVIAPATAASIAKMAHGVADNMLITTYLSMKAPVFIAPAMDLDMFAHPSTQENLAQLKRYGNIIIEPAEGELASHLVGKGRMAEPEDIFAFVGKSLAEKQAPETLRLNGKTVLVTAGPTIEKIDPVRYISNFSTGKMGYAIADACAEQGAKVILISGPVNGLETRHKGIEKINVVSASDMYEAATKAFPACDAAILCAAVADYTPARCAEQKIKTHAATALELTPTQDIAAALGRMKTAEQRLVGFALETNDEQEHARAKLKKKNLDFIVLNSLRDPGAGFACDTNKVTMLFADGKTLDFPLKDKHEVANDLTEQLCALF